ncbi:hypothetical protein Q428_08785 [Fervidicella metallireducens AeB]|uniref:Mor transcription activator domain-containing protein n=1 Tax=Fervidicella metallireducens AeB TaxID=1403537 RepID=A0A017RUI4_9CLOT|nr:Mor transcription activator family protein [Fervidicella metallireducens]EYE88286.1 hypothetical protein Q428_08785 [Fervidicella metallireducens AeB]
MLDGIEINDLPPNQKDIAELIGFENYKKLVCNFGGNNVYIQKEDTLTKNVRNKKIVEMFNGNNYLELSKKFNLTERAIRTIITEELAVKEGEQITLFEIE